MENRNNLAWIGYTGEEKMYLDPNKFRHLLIAGETGSGKSVLMNGLITEFMQLSDTEYIALFDLKRVEFGRYRLIADTYTDIEEMNRAINNLHEMMMERFEEMDSRGISNWDGGHTYIFIDEYADITTHENTECAKNIQSKVASIARMGRAAKYHLVIATQYPTAKVVNMQLKMNCQKICLKCNSDIGYRVMLDRKYVDLKGKGDALYQDEEGKIIRFQVSHFTEGYINQFIKNGEEYFESIQSEGYMTRKRKYSKGKQEAERKNIDSLRLIDILLGRR